MATPLPDNVATFTLAEILTLTGGHVRGPLGDGALHVRGVSTDSRTLSGGEVFVALPGERFDGHDHLHAAHDRGASLAIVERDVLAPAGLTRLLVRSTLEALGQLAAAHLRRWRRTDAARRVVAVTGSAGKTTTKEAIGALLSRVDASERVWMSPGNLNNLVGVPMVVLSLTDSHRWAVLELGTSRLGEISKLARMVRPDVGVVTLISSAHGQGLGGIEAIAKEKLALYEHLAPAGAAIGNADDARIHAGLSSSGAAERIAYGHAEDADYRIERRVLHASEGARITLASPDGTRVEASIPLLGRAGALAALAAVATVRTALGRGVSGDELGEAMATITSSSRLEPKRGPAGLLVIDDSYNANPASCASSIETASEIAQNLGRRLVLVLGEMRELGAASAEGHDEVGVHAAASGAALVIAVGGEAERIAFAARARGTEAEVVADADAGATLALMRVHSEDLVLVKGSRGVGTERVVQALMARGAGAAGRGGPAHRSSGVLP